MRIKKQGLDYFPLDTDIMQNRLVRRIMKREGDGAFTVFLGVLSLIYSGEGYYVQVDDMFYDDLAASLFEKDAADVERIIRLALDYGLFDAGLFARYGILTSEHIQQQYLFCIRRRRKRAIDPRFCLCEEDGEDEAAGTSENGIRETAEAEPVAGKRVTQTAENVTQTPQNVTRRTQSKAQQSIAQQSKENPLLQGSPDSGGTTLPTAEKEEAVAGPWPGGDWGREAAGARTGHHADPAPGSTDPCARPADGECAPAMRPVRQWTDADIDTLVPPPDGLRRNLDGLKDNLRRLRVPLNEQYALILKSNFGVIGHPVWRGFYTLRESHGKIRQPGRYLLSLCQGCGRR